MAMASDPETPILCRVDAGAHKVTKEKMMFGMKFIELFRSSSLLRKSSTTRRPAPAIALDVLLGGGGGVAVRFFRGRRPAAVFH
jgi:hypothetical protein